MSVTTGQSTQFHIPEKFNLLHIFTAVFTFYDKGYVLLQII